MAASWAKLIKKDLYNGLQYPDGKIFEYKTVLNKLYYGETYPLNRKKLIK